MHQSYANSNAVCGQNQITYVVQRVQLITVLNCDQVIKPLQGYNCPVWKQVIFAASVTATLGASWLLANFWPTFMILLKLQACSVTQASYVKFQVTQSQSIANNAPGNKQL